MLSSCEKSRAATYLGIVDLQVFREWTRFPAECRQSGDRTPQTVCCRILALGGQREEKPIKEENQGV